ncbi:STE3-like pheromone receptor [Gloeophyllum trabeum ATCC 11539]|uniref:STE3-like pheromone receptor n=1 Tax=Gloeophyllum trabeum (strain ATCC 11539 / FP-39264 / Madison 617) TaxID=670483 RepID=S7RRL2_GLOTA|nr:STE3-like pheromone receptor [Gloeophyllum trabeum ATCC 11539]EPQ55604.1 STE3-like pheromone receptor [Gloeophyllum trabeum ATCC 11539]
MHHPEFPTIAFLCATLILLPLPWHWRAANVATLSIIVWLFVLNVIYGVDAVIWANNAEIVIPVWCDITTKIIVGGNFALPAACLCICIHLEQVSSLRAARTTLPEKRRRQIIEALMCFGLPAVFMALHYIVQGHRFDIIEDFGCRPAIYASVPALILMWVVPLFLATLALGFAGCALMHFIQRRASFAKHLNSQAGLTTARYLRLIMMAVVEMVIGIAFTGYTVWFNSANLQSWTGWADVHWHFSQIAQYPTILLPQMFLRTYTVLWWMVPVATLTFVAFFAFGEDAVNEYKACFSWIASKILRLKPRRPSAKSRHTSSLPVAW